MKKMFYFIPALMVSILILLIWVVMGNFDGLSPMAAVYLILLITAGVLLSKNYWWGAFFGLPYGITVIVSDIFEKGQITRKWPFGLLVCIFYVICGMICYLDGKKIR